ncbi:hypothetical protein FHS07_001902 [Microbacterium proteolyticum]|uniref:Uncharacterized protein n=1 Tax=Microbacterium proteolyticum TaxID=1572644 RepID=A0A7W5CIB9_9MICO|nr:SGNH/GDSL hydrolase family protein [Microbacterium proteolyticum]MBB3158206.1 hypothetical protein [Microbacterium proteolyticum]
MSESYGFVVGRFLSPRGAAASAGAEPAGVAARGSVRMTPKGVARMAEATPPATAVAQPLVLTVDAEGFVVDPSGRRGLWVVVGSWVVTLTFEGVAPSSYQVTVTAEHTEAAPLDLTLAAPLVETPTTKFVVNEAVYAETIGARDEAVAAADRATAPAQAMVDAAVGGSLAPLSTRVGTVEVSVPRMLDTRESFAALTAQLRGDSWIEFGSYGAMAYPYYLPERLGFAGLVNRGRAGWHAQDIAWLMAASGGGYAWTPGDAPVLIINAGGNNLIDADTSGNRAAISQSLRAMVAIASASARVEETGWTYRPNASGQQWMLNQPQPYASGGTASIGVHDGLEVDIPVPAGTSYLLCHGVALTAGRGATLRIRQGARVVAVQSLDDQTVQTTREGNQGASQGVSPLAIRLPDLAEGIVTVTVDQNGVAGSAAIIDALLPQAARPPFVFLVKPPPVLAASHQKPALRAHLLSSIDGTAAEFGAHVLAVNADGGWDAAAMLGEDGLHPNLAGAVHMADAFPLAVRARAWDRILRDV